MTTSTAIDIPPFDPDLLEAVADTLDLRAPNRDAIETLARRLYAHYDERQPGFFEGVIDAATGVGKTYAMAGALDYLAAQGIRDFAVIAPGSTILEKTIAQFTPGTPRSLLGHMACEPVLVHAGNFDSPAIATAFEDSDVVKLFVFTVQALTKPTEKAGRKTHRTQDTHLPRGSRERPVRALAGARRSGRLRGRAPLLRRTEVLTGDPQSRPAGDGRPDGDARREEARQGRRADHLPLPARGGHR